MRFPKQRFIGFWKSPQTLRAFLFISVFALTVLTCVLRYGYSFGVHDQWVLAPKGISMADPSAFAGDWFTHQAPQPHWLFDDITALGEKFGVLQETYFTYWLLTALVTALFFLWFFEWTQKPWLALAAPALLALGPISPLGSGTTMWGWALPHCLGGSLAILSLVAWMTSRYRWCNFLLLAATAVHVQHGAHAAGLILVGSLFFKNFRSVWWGCLGSLLAVVVIAKMIGLSGSGDMVLTACQKYIQGHCMAPSWPAELFLPAGFLTFGILMALFADSKKHKTFLFLSFLTALGLYVGLGLDLINLESISWLPRRFNIYRLVSFLVPFAIMGFLLGLSFCIENWRHKPFKLVPLLVLSLAALTTWLASSTSSFEGQWVPALLCSLLILAALLMSQWNFSRIFKLKEALLALIPIPLFFVPTYSPQKSFQSLEAIGNSIQTVVPPGKLILASPSLVWFRFYTRRAVIADVKAIPYQLKEFSEWEDRIRDLGGFDYSGLKYSRLNYQDWSHIVRKYSPQYAFVMESDSSAAEILQNHKVTLNFATNPRIYLVEIQSANLH